MFSSLFNPRFPKNAIGFERGLLSVVSLQKKGRRQFEVRRAATIDLPDYLLRPSFSEANIADPDEMLITLREAAKSAGLGGQKRWSASLPGETGRAAILTLEMKPSANKELAEMLNWKAERSFGAEANELHLAFQPLSNDASGKARYFAVAVKNDVLSEYEDIFDALGWQVGMILPRHVSESNWLTLEKTNGDSLLISSQADGFTAMLLRKNQPAVVRSVSCELTERDDEIYRLLLFYRDRFSAENIGADYNLEKFLVVGGGFSHRRLNEIINETLGYTLPILRPEDVGLHLSGDEVKFDEVAAPAALASLAFA